jgi:hypothetical protein
MRIIHILFSSIRPGRDDRLGHQSVLARRVERLSGAQGGEPLTVKSVNSGFLQTTDVVVTIWSPRKF